MRISTEWLSEWIETPEHAELDRIFTMAGLGVEGFEDGVYELEVTSNRGDWLSVLGIAREVAAMTGKRKRGAQFSVEENGDTPPLSVRIEDIESCPRYLGRIIENIQVGPSPDWMQQRLEEAGMRAVNNVVDVTNYVMLELGQPLHAFDADTIPGGEIVVRRAHDGEQLETLDGTNRVLTSEMLVIADREKAVAVAGVMGGAATEVTEKTTRILLESAHFDAARVRRAARALSLPSEASRRFERGVDPNGVRRAADRAAELLAQVAGGKITSSVADEYPQLIEPTKLTLRIARCNAILGLKLSSENVTSLLQRLDFSVQTIQEGLLQVEAPTFRRDISREIDLIEEVARIHGYDQIPTTLPKTVNPGAGRSLSQRIEERAKSALLRCGLTEVVTLPMENEAEVSRAGLDVETPVVKFSNPLSEDYTQLRTTLIPSLLRVLEKNARWGIRAFELAKVYLPQGEGQLPNECRRLGIALLPPVAPQGHWQKNRVQNTNDFFEAKAAIETTFAELGAPKPHWYPVKEAGFHPGRCAALYLDGQHIGTLGEIHPDVAARYNIKGRAIVGRVDFDAVVRHISLLKQYEPLPRFPAIERDLALVIAAEQSATNVESVLKNAGGELLRRVQTFDVYTGNPIPEGFKSVALSLLFRADDRTLTDAEIEERMGAVREAAQKELDAQLR